MRGLVHLHPCEPEQVRVLRAYPCDDPSLAEACEKVSISCLGNQAQQTKMILMFCKQSYQSLAKCASCSRLQKYEKVEKLTVND